MVGKYRIIARLGSGSQGTVYRAYDPTLERDVALKVLHPHLATPDVIERFRREGRIVASISHPNIAVISEIGEHNGVHFIAIEYVPHAASELIGRGAMDAVHAASIAHQTALALEAARASRHGITHHDVKPDNLLLTSLDEGCMVKLIDFGIAHAEGMTSMTQTGSRWGTPFYMPPEQWAGERGDTRSDVYSLGVVMYQMLAGRAPFDSDAENALAKQNMIANQHLAAAPAPLRSVRADVPEALEAVVAKCMAKSPSERYQTPGELANELAGMFGLAAPDASIAASRPPVQSSPEPRLGRRPTSPRPYRPPIRTPPIFDMPPYLRNRGHLAAAAAMAFLAIVTLIIVASRVASQSGDDMPPRVMVVSAPTNTPMAPPPVFVNAPAPTATFTPTPIHTPTPTATFTPTPQATSTPQPRGRYGRFYRESEELPHEDDWKIERLTTFRNVRNFAISADFEVPYSASVSNWSVGFIFRETQNDLSYVAVTRDGVYSHYEVIDGEFTRLDNGYVSNWSQSVGDKNKMNLVVIEGRGWLFLNSYYVTDLDVSGASEWPRGSLAIATGFFTGDEVPGETTRVSDIRASALEKLHGPSSGWLAKIGTSIPTYYANVNLDFAYASAEFRTPDDNENWSAGLMFRKRGREDYLIFAIRSSGSWEVLHAPTSGGGSRDITRGYSSEIDIDNPIFNRIEVFYMEKVAVVYVNGQLLSAADISAISGSGDVRVAYGIYRNNNHRTAKYENFVVYGLPTD